MKTTVEKSNNEDKIKENTVSSFFYYMWNAWCKEECEAVFEGGYEHFWSKWLGRIKETSFGAAEKFYADLTTGNRLKLVKRACEVYNGNKRIENYGK